MMYFKRTEHKTASNSEMDEWSPPIYRDLGIISEMQHRTIEGCRRLRRVKPLQTIAEKIPIGLVSNLGSVLVTDGPHGAPEKPAN